MVTTQRTRRIGLILLVVCLWIVNWRAQAGEEVVRFVVEDRVLNRVDSRLFGQFLERASWGEPGPEQARIPGTRRLQPQVVELLSRMKIPLVRFPGGTDIDYIDWRDMVDHVRGRSGWPAGRSISPASISPIKWEESHPSPK